jgi:hypothetical protein
MYNNLFPLVFIFEWNAIYRILRILLILTCRFMHKVRNEDCALNLFQWFIPSENIYRFL